MSDSISHSFLADATSDPDNDLFGEPSLGGLSPGGSVFDTLNDEMIKKEVKKEPEVPEVCYILCHIILILISNGFSLTSYVTLYPHCDHLLCLCRK